MGANLPCSRKYLIVFYKPLALQLSDVLHHSVKMLQCRGAVPHRLVRRQERPGYPVSILAVHLSKGSFPVGVMT